MIDRTRNTRRFSLALVCLGFAMRAGAAQQYTAVDLGFSSAALGAYVGSAGPRQVGNAFLGGSGGHHAVIWSSQPAGAVDLTPTGFFQSGASGGYSSGGIEYQV